MPVTLTEDQTDLAKAIGDFCRREIGTKERRDELTGGGRHAHSDEIYRKMADLGWLGRWTVLDGAEGARPGARSTAAVVGPGDCGPRASGADPTDPASLIPALLHG